MEQVMQRCVLVLEEKKAVLWWWAVFMIPMKLWDLFSTVEFTDEKELTNKPTDQRTHLSHA